MRYDFGMGYVFVTRDNVGVLLEGVVGMLMMLHVLLGVRVREVREDREFREIREQ